MLYTLGLLGLCIAWLLPGHYVPWTSFQQDAFAAGGATLVGLAAIVTTRQWPVRLPAMAGFALLLALVPLAQWVFGAQPYRLDAALPAAYLVAFAMAIVAGRQLAEPSGRFVLALFGVIWIAAIASIGIGLVQWLQIGPYDFIEQTSAGERVSGNLRQPNQLASLFGLAVAATLWAFVTRRVGPWGAALAMATFGFGVAMTQSRAGWLFVALIVLFWVLYRRRVPLRMHGASLVVGVGAFIAAVVSWDRLNAWLQSGAHFDSLASRVQPGNRLLHWQTLWDALLQSPWIGYGWLQVPRAQQAVTLDHAPTFEFLSSSHNQLLDLLLWNGLPIGALVLGAVTWWAVSRMRACNDAQSWALLLALSFLFAHSMVEFPLQYAYFLLPAGFMIGIIESGAPAPAEPARGINVGRWPYLAALGAMGLLLALIVREYGELEEQVRRVRLAEVGYVQPGGEPRVPNVDLLDWQREYVRLFLTEPRAGMPPQQLQWMTDIATRYPSPTALMRLARSQALNGQPARAERSLRILCHISLERHCDDGRKHWDTLAQTDERMRLVRYPETPRR